ncbi:protein FAM133 isoform X3 [Procambarus clarkii]
MPDMEGVVSEELRHRIERVLAFPTGRTAGEESTTETTPTNGQDDRCPAGGLLQDYLDQLEPEGEDDEELIFQGSESGESDADLLYDSEKETYTTPYLLFLQQARSRKRDLPVLQRKLLDDDPTEDEEKGTKATEDGREGAMGRSGYRSSVPTTFRTFSKEPPTSASNSKEPQTPASTSKEPPTPVSDDADQEHPKVYFRRASRDQTDERSKSDTGNHIEFEKHVGISGETDEEFLLENDQDEVAHDQSQKKKKKKKKKKRKKGSQGEVTDEETEEEVQKANLEELKKSIALELFRDFAKNVFAKDHPEFRLFESFEEFDKSKESDVIKAAHES